MVLLSQWLGVQTAQVLVLKVQVEALWVWEWVYLGWTYLQALAYTLW